MYKRIISVILIFIIMICCLGNNKANNNKQEKIYKNIYIENMKVKHGRYIQKISTLDIK